MRVGTAPLGFAIVEMPKTGSTTLSPRTQATLQRPVELVIAVPQDMVDIRYGSNGWYFTNGTEANWSAPTIRQVRMTNPDGYTFTYDVFTFTWLGNRTQSTVADGSAPASWAKTAITGGFYPNTGYYCVVPQNSTWYFSNYYAGGTATNLGQTEGRLGTFTTANGFTGNVRPNDGSGWVKYTSN